MSGYRSMGEPAAVYCGKVRCLQCGKPFESSDRRRFRLCNGCRERTLKRSDLCEGDYIYQVD